MARAVSTSGSTTRTGETRTAGLAASWACAGIEPAASINAAGSAASVRAIDRERSLFFIYRLEDYWALKRAYFASKGVSVSNGIKARARRTHPRSWHQTGIHPGVCFSGGFAVATTRGTAGTGAPAPAMSPGAARAACWRASWMSTSGTATADCGLDLLQLLLCDPVAVPAGNLGCEVDVLPKRAVAGTLEAVEAVEQVVDEARYAAEAVGGARPIVDRQHGWNGDRLDLFARLQEVRIVLRWSASVGT